MYQASIMWVIEESFILLPYDWLIIRALRNTIFLCVIFSPFWSDEENGHEVIEKRCGDIERNEFDYNEGCETTKVPFKNKVCYCKTSLCNGASTFADTFYSLKLAITLIGIYFLTNFYWYIYFIA